jgi:UDP-N-acetylmuramate--alanine ligase
LNEFATAFGDAQHALILPIYRPSGREVAARPVTSADLAQRIQQQGHADARALESFEAVEATVVKETKPGDIVITMGAGDVTLLSDRLVEALA